MLRCRPENVFAYGDVITAESLIADKGEGAAKISELFAKRTRGTRRKVAIGAIKYSILRQASERYYF